MIGGEPKREREVLLKRFLRAVDELLEISNTVTSLREDFWERFVQIRPEAAEQLRYYFEHRNEFTEDELKKMEEESSQYKQDRERAHEDLLKASRRMTEKRQEIEQLSDQLNQLK